MLLSQSQLKYMEEASQADEVIRTAADKPGLASWQDRATADNQRACLFIENNIAPVKNYVN